MKQFVVKLQDGRSITVAADVFGVTPSGAILFGVKGEAEDTPYGPTVPIYDTRAVAPGTWSEVEAIGEA